MDHLAVDLPGAVLVSEVQEALMGRKEMPSACGGIQLRLVQSNPAVRRWEFKGL